MTTNEGPLHLRRIFYTVLLVCLSGGIASGLTVDRVLATVNNEVVSLSDYRKFVARVGQASDPETVSEHHLRKLIEERLIIQEAKRNGIDATDDEVSRSIGDIMKQNGISLSELEKRFAGEGMTVAEYKSLLKENLMSLRVIDREVNARVVVGAGDITQFYEKNRDLFLESPERVLVKAIYLKLGESATLTEITDLKLKSLRIHAEIRKGESFEKLAMQYTDDSLKRQDAVLGEFERGALIPVLNEKIFSMKEGEVSEPVWTKDGCYILKVVRRTEAVYIPAEMVREHIRNMLHEQRSDEAFNEWMKRLWEKASIRIQQQ
jgi:parvulin-like peptidyl-prolyl isomerase